MAGTPSQAAAEPPRHTRLQPTTQRLVQQQAEAEVDGERGRTSRTAVRFARDRIVDEAEERLRHRASPSPSSASAPAAAAPPPQHPQLLHRPGQPGLDQAHRSGYPDGHDADDDHDDGVTPGILPSTYVDPSPANSPFLPRGPKRHRPAELQVRASRGTSADSSADPRDCPPRDRGTWSAASTTSDQSDSYFMLPRADRGDVAHQAAQPVGRPPRRPVRGTMDRRESLTDIRAANPELSLSGSVISATFTIPNTLSYRREAGWTLRPRQGQSALFHSFAYLSSDATPWNHTVVAWTGEIDTHDDERSHPLASTASIGESAQTALSAPVPVDAHSRLPTPPHVDDSRISQQDRAGLEYQLSHSKTIRTIPVWLADDADRCEDGALRLRDQPRWRKYAQQALYTLFHYKQLQPTDGRKERLQWADYYRMNQAFANRIIEVYKPGDIVIVHDYYLMLLPSMLRQRIPNIYLSFFLHSPFPSSEFLRCLPQRKEILEGVLSANLIGFQSYSYARHFLSCCTRVLGFPSDRLGIDAYGTRVQVGVFPIGIDAAKVEAFAWAKPVTEKYEALKRMYKGRKVIVGRDRLDSVRGIAQKLEAFERFLEMYPEWREKVVLIQVTSPANIDEEKDDPENRVGSRVNELIMKINGQYGSLSFSPVQHYSQYLSQDEYFALLRAGDIGLITSVRDGMNTTSLEYIVCQKQAHGPLILSEFSGTAGSLCDAIHINPWDLSGVAEKINAALLMPEEQRSAMQQSLYQHVTTYNVQSWINKFIQKVHTVLGESSTIKPTPVLDRSLLLAQYRSAAKRLFMFDYDGTLTPIVGEPSAAVPSKRIIHALQSLAADAANAVWIISGRDQDFLKQHLGHIPQLGFSAEHGSFIRNPGSEEWINLAEKYDLGWQGEVMAVFQKYTDEVPRSFIERKRCALTWHYRAAEAELGTRMARACIKALEAGVATQWDVEVMPGKANIEVRPTFINKGEIAKRLIATYHNPSATATPHEPNPGKVEFALCMGDDFTDEDMFRSLNGASGPILREDHVFTVTVGASTKMTLAKWHLLEPEDVVECIALLAGTEGSAGSERMGKANLAAVSAVEGRIPSEEKT